MIKRFICFAVLCLLFVFLFNGCTSTPDVVFVEPKVSYTTDAEISPLELFHWEVVFMSFVNDEGIYYIVSQNPLINTPINYLIKYILCRVDNTRNRLTAYAYYLEGELFVFQLKTRDKTLSTGHFTHVEDLSEKARNVIDYYLLSFLDMDKT